MSGSVSVAQRRASADQPDYARLGNPIATPAPDAQIRASLHEASPDRIRQNIERLVAFNNRSTVSSTETDLKPGTGVLAAADWIRSQFEEYSKACGGCLEVKVDEFVEQPQPGFGNSKPRIVRPTPLRNVYAILRGTDPVASKRMYLVTGHYDTRVNDVMDTHGFAPGANDDSSGTAVSMESARVLSQHKFPATIVFVCVAGEEQGLNGSAHLAKLAKSEGWQLEGVLNNDIVGGDTTPGDTLQSKTRVRVFSQGILPTAPIEQIRAALSVGGESEGPSRQLAREVLEVDRTYLEKLKGNVNSAHGSLAGTQPQELQAVMELRLDRFLRGGDHKSFSDQGFPAVRFTEWRENFNHQHQTVRQENGVEYGDLLKFDDFHYIAQVARLNMATLGTLAMSPGVPQNVKVVTSNLDNDTILTWDPPASPTPGPVRYEIVWRETAVNDWQYAADAARYSGTVGEHSVRLPVSKDNVFFGVRACSGTACSQAVPPVPAR
ncbi:M28 family metallopeptidase [Terriglobus aquaticus]|uniref:M28 family metallopeptidase n=1 Tax=Terriglobus aquaticus TaxID=940139 RepID=A0ABW9KRJ5_9BACT|nr:M28 family metallopeptidase [Terriglobus aquaticus]